MLSATRHTLKLRDANQYLLDSTNILQKQFVTDSINLPKRVFRKKNKKLQTTRKKTLLTQRVPSVDEFQYPPKAITSMTRVGE